MTRRSVGLAVAAAIVLMCAAVAAPSETRTHSAGSKHSSDRKKAERTRTTAPKHATERKRTAERKSTKRHAKDEEKHSAADRRSLALGPRQQAKDDPPTPRPPAQEVQPSSRKTVAQGEFERLTGYPHGRRGYVIEYIRPLEKGGWDDPGNMRWRKLEATASKNRSGRKR